MNWILSKRYHIRDTVEDLERRVEFIQPYLRYHYMLGRKIIVRINKFWSHKIPYHVHSNKIQWTRMRLANLTEAGS